MATLFVDKVDPQSGTSLEIGSSGDTITIPSGCTITNNGTQTGFGGTMTPAFEATLGSNQNLSNNTFTKVQFNTEIFDTDNTYDNSTNYRFTPGVAGKYVLSATAQVQNCGNGNIFYVGIYKNGSALKTNNIIPGSSDDLSGMITYIDVANTTDYYEIYARQGSGGSSVFLTNDTYFSAYRIIE